MSEAMELADKLIELHDRYSNLENHVETRAGALFALTAKLKASLPTIIAALRAYKEPSGLTTSELVQQVSDAFLTSTGATHEPG